MSLWLGDTIGVFAVGALALLIRRSSKPKNYLLRLTATALGALIPIVILIVLVLTLGYESDAIQDRWGAILTMLAVVTGLAGFYIPSWLFNDNREGELPS